MLDGDNNTLPEDSVPDLRGVVDRLRSFDKFLGHSSKDLDEVVLVDHNQSLLDFNESCMLTINKSNIGSQQQPVKHEGILEMILAKQDKSTAISKVKESSPYSQNPTSSLLRDSVDSKNGQVQKKSHSDALCVIGESPEERKSHREMRGRRSRSRDNNLGKVSNKSTSPHSSSRKGKSSTSMNEHDATKVHRTDQETQNVVPRIASSPSLSKGQHVHQQRRRDKADPLSLSLHGDTYSSTTSTSSGNRHSRHGLYSAMGRSSDHGARRVTTKSKYQDLLKSTSEHVPTSTGTLKTTLERKTSSSSMVLSSTSNRGEEDSTGQRRSQSPSRPTARPGRRTRNTSPQSEVKSSSRDNHERKKRQSHRSPRGMRPPSSQVPRSMSTPRTSLQSIRSKKASSSTDLVAEGEQPLSRRSRSSEDIADQAASSSRDQRLSSNRRRLKSRGSLGESTSNEQSRNDNLKRMENLHSFFGTRGGSGIITTTSTAQVRRLGSSGELRSPIPHQTATEISDVTKPAITQRTMNHLMLDLRRETSRNMIQKFKPTRNLQAGLVDDI